LVAIDAYLAELDKRDSELKANELEINFNLSDNISQELVEK
jgi:hypothetical protein